MSIAIVTIPQIGRNQHANHSGNTKQQNREGGLVKSFTETEQGRVRCYYRLTTKGGSELREQRTEWQRYTSAVELVLREA